MTEERGMRSVAITLIGLSAVGFLLAVVSSFIGALVPGVSTEALSRASTNLSLIAIALAVWFKEGAR